MYSIISLFLFSIGTYFSQINVQHLSHDKDYWTNIAILDTILVVIIIASYKFNTITAVFSGKRRNNITIKKRVDFPPSLFSGEPGYLSMYLSRNRILTM